VNIDSYSAIGEFHKGGFCQDYIRTGIGDRPFIIVSDGCSSSPDTDVGSRLVSLCAEKNLKYSSSRVYEHEFITDILIHQTMTDARRMANELSLDESCLDATLLVAQVFPEKKKLAFMMCGDGFVFWKMKDKAPVIVQVEFSQNAPYYPTLETCAGFKVQWKHAFPDNKMQFIQHGQEKIALDLSKTEPSTFDGVMSTEGLEWFGLATDGIASFRVDNPNGVQIDKLFHEIFDFKSMAGAFLQRRMNRQMKMWREGGFINMDDLSLAMMYYFGD